METPESHSIVARMDCNNIQSELFDDELEIITRFNNGEINIELVNQLIILLACTELFYFTEEDFIYNRLCESRYAVLSAGAIASLADSIDKKILEEGAALYCNFKVVDGVPYTLDGINIIGSAHAPCLVTIKNSMVTFYIFEYRYNFKENGW